MVAAAFSSSAREALYHKGIQFMRGRHYVIFNSDRQRHDFIQEFEDNIWT